MKRRALAMAFASIPMLVAPSALAQEHPSSPSKGPSVVDARAMAEMLFYTGRAQMEEGRFAEACPKLEESYRLDHATGTLLNMALCHEKEGRIASAWTEFRNVAAEARQKNQADRLEAAEQHIQDLETKLPYLTVEVPKQVRVPGLEVTRQSDLLVEAAWGVDLPVDPGKVVVEWKAPGYLPARAQIDVAKQAHLSVTLHALQIKPIEVPPPPFWTTKRVVGAGLVVAGLGGGAAGTIFGLEAASEKKDSDAACPTYLGQTRCTQAGASAMSRATTDAWVSDLGFAVGALSLGAGAYLLISGGEKWERFVTPQTPPAGTAGPPLRIRFAMAPVRAGAGGVLSGEFE